MFLFESKELFIGNKENGGTAVSKEIPIPSKNAGIFCLTIELTPQLSVRRARRYTVLHSRNDYDPRLLRVTSSQSGYDAREPAQRAGLLRGDQVGVWLYTVHHYIPPTSKTASCFCWVLFHSARPTRRVGMLRGDNRGGLGLCITLFRRRQKR